jgi:DNA-directed RNA polymerase specialized sigma24 family protein
MSELSPATIEATPAPLSEVEIRSEISSLTAGERTRLIRIASYYGRISSEEPDELVQEAICRVLAEKREWPRGLEKIRFLAGVIKSIAGDRKRVLSRNVSIDDVKEQEVGDKGADERGIMAKIDLQRIMTYFDDDPIAQKILMAMAHGTRGEDLEQAGGLSPTEYESKRKKIRRRIEKLKT